MDPTTARDVAAFRLAREYLLTFAPEGVTDAVIDHYVEPPVTRLRPATMNGIYLRVLASAQNANMRANVVGGAIGGVERLEGVLCAFDPAAVSRCFGDRWEDVLDAVEASGLLPHPVRREPRSIWRLFCRSALSGAAFLRQFDDADDFYAWVEVFDKDDRIRLGVALPEGQGHLRRVRGRHGGAEPDRTEPPASSGGAGTGSEAGVGALHILRSRQAVISPGAVALLLPESPPRWRDLWTRRHARGISRHFSRQNGGLVRSGASTRAPCAYGDAHALSSGPCADVRADFVDKKLDALYTHERDEHRTRRGGGLPEVSA